MAVNLSDSVILFLFLLQQHTDELNTQVALHQLYQYASKYYDGVGYHDYRVTTVYWGALHSTMRK